MKLKSFVVILLVAIQSHADDIFINGGQSNMVGPMPHPQPFDSILGYQPYSGLDRLFGNDYVLKKLGDPYDINTNQVDTVSSDNTSGSFVPITATNLDSHISSTLMFVPCAFSGTVIEDWLPSGTSAFDHTNRSTLYGSMNYREHQAATNGTVKCLLWWQWESNGINGTPTNSWVSNTCYFADQWFADTGTPVMVCIPQISNPASATPINATTNVMYQVATRGMIGTHHIIQGPDFSDLVTDDSYHLSSDAHAVIVGNRWAGSIITNFYTAAIFRPAPFR